MCIQNFSSFSSFSCSRFLIKKKMVYFFVQGEFKKREKTTNTTAKLILFIYILFA